MNQQQKKTLTILSAAGLVLALGAPGAMAGVVDNVNNSAPLGACGAANAADTVACVGAWNLDNVQVDLIRLVDGSTFGAFDANPASSNYGTYTQMVVGDSFVSKVYSDSTKTTLMAKVGGKVWPVGEPTAIKAVNGDAGTVPSGKPENCLINTSYLDSTDTGNVNAAYLDTANPQPVICSSPFQSHKRFKVAMQPATTTAVTSGDGHPIDLVFNTTDNNAVTPYQVFSKINNYTDKRLAGYKIEVGVGTGGGFQTATALGISDQLFLTLGLGESTKTAGQDLFAADAMATFSHGLFGPVELPHFPTEGFFSNTTAFYHVVQTCTNSTATCPADVTVGGITMTPSDTIESSGVLSANYTNVMGTDPNLFGAWLPSIWEPKGIFFDFDSNPSTDPKLVAWWNGTQWLKGQADNFAPVSQTEFNTWASDSRYSIDVIEDVLNLGINYIVHVGDINPGSPSIGAYAGSNTFTIRIIPVVSADQTVPAWVGTTPTPLVVPSSGGGCTIGGDGHFDPTFPALLLAGLGFFGLRRFSRKS